MKKPFFSIIIPTFNRHDNLNKCLNRISSLNYSPTNFEVIVVNDGGETPPDKMIASYKSQINIIVINQNNCGPAAARNSGAKLAKGEFLAFTDDDCQPDRDWLIIFEDYLGRNPDCLIGGRTLNLLIDNIYSTASQDIVGLIYEYYNKNPEKANFFSSNNMALSKQRFLEVGGFDEQFRTAEDRDLCRRWLNKGLNIIYAHDALTHHAHKLNFITFVKQHFNYGRGAYLFYIKGTEKGRAYFKDLWKFNLSPQYLLIYPFSQHKGLRGLSLVSLMILWQITNAAGFIFELMNNKLKTSNTPI